MGIHDTTGQLWVMLPTEACTTPIMLQQIHEESSILQVCFNVTVFVFNKQINVNANKENGVHLTGVKHMAYMLKSLCILLSFKEHSHHVVICPFCSFFLLLCHPPICCLGLHAVAPQCQCLEMAAKGFWWSSIKLNTYYPVQYKKMLSTLE